MHRVSLREGSMNAEEVVRAELDAWSILDVDGIMAHFASDAIWDDPSHGPIAGRDNIRQAVAGYVSRMTRAEMEIVHLVAADNIVMTERVDHFTFDGKQVAAAIMGVFEVTGNKITAWRDYFDMGGTRS
jgi:limonene-1,2-epoxide hydrolase